MASSTSDFNRTIAFADPPTSTNYVYASVPLASLNQQIMDVAFVSSIDSDNYPGGLEQQVLDHRFDDGVILSDYWAHKYILDLDGNSYSGKFFAFLGSDSVVIKSSVYHEFFSDWIQPWCVLFLCSVHVPHVPLTMDVGFQASLHSAVHVVYRDIQRHAFFSGGTPDTLALVNSTAQHLSRRQRIPVEGDIRLRRIARAGKHWKNTIGRQVDMEGEPITMSP
jgi:hypothetical protein